MHTNGSVPSAGPRQLPSGKLGSSLPASQHCWKRMVFRCSQKLVPALKVDLRSSTNEHQHALSLGSARARGQCHCTHPTGRSMLGWLITKYPQAPTLNQVWWAWPTCQCAYTPASEHRDNRGISLFMSFQIFGFLRVLGT